MAHFILKGIQSHLSISSLPSKLTMMSNPRLFSAASKELDLRDKLPKKRANVLERLGPPVKMPMADEATSSDGQVSQDMSDMSWNIQ